MEMRDVIYLGINLLLFLAGIVLSLYHYLLIDDPKRHKTNQHHAAYYAFWMILAGASFFNVTDRVWFLVQ
jgi:hypothetical protein